MVGIAPAPVNRRPHRLGTNLARHMAAVPQELSDRQREIVDTARELLARDGVEELSLGNVAKAIGIKTPSLYKHFAGRADLESALIAQGMAELGDALEAAGADLHAVGAAYRTWALANPELYRLMTSAPLARDKLPEGLEARILIPLHKVISDPHLARATFALAHGLVSLEISQRFPPWSKLEKSWDRALNAFAAAKPPG
jgi:AcrR family transcriptional regulator